MQLKNDIDDIIHITDSVDIDGLHTVDTLPENNIAVMSVALPDITVMSALPSVAFRENIESTDRINTVIETLKQDSRVKHVQKNFLYKLSTSVGTDREKEDTNKKFRPSVYTGRTLQNDTDFDTMWSLDNHGQNVNGTIGIPDADIDYPEALSYASGRLSQTGVIVAVLDTGIAYDHPEFDGQLWDGTMCVSDTGGFIG